MRRWLGSVVVVGLFGACGGGDAGPATTSTVATSAASTTVPTTTRPVTTTTRPLVDHEAWPALMAYYEARQEAVRRKDPSYIDQFIDQRGRTEPSKIPGYVAEDIAKGRTGKVIVHSGAIQFERANVFGEPSVSFEVRFTDESKTATFWYGMSKVEGRTWKLGAVSLQPFAL